MGFIIRQDDLAGSEIADLLRLHLAEMYRNSPACSVHAMPIERLRAPDVTFWSVWEEERLAGCGALKALSDTHGEIKSMRTAPDFLRRGVGERMLLHLIEEARRRGYSRLSLETGSGPSFVPAIALYAKHGFKPCGRFGDYADDPFLRFMTCAL
jgi:putative acetyltransferase